MKLPDISIIGSGNVATQLGMAFATAGCSVKEVYSPTPAHAKALAQKLNVTPADSIGEIREPDILLIAVSDDAIGIVANQLSPGNAIVVHTSGTVPLGVLANSAGAYGVIYPLQTFSSERQVDMSKVPFLIEASNEACYGRLEQVVLKISGNVRNVNSEDRLKYHLSAVIANNFSNHLWREASDYLIKNNLEFSALQPLIRETVDKALELGPANAQTGPAKRNDQGTIRKHLELLEGEELRSLYEFFTTRIKSIS